MRKPGIQKAPGPIAARVLLNCCESPRWKLMHDSIERNFGLTIAYVLPGFVCLWGASALSPLLTHWLAVDPTSNPSIANFLYTLLASLATGLIVSAVRWAAVDTLHHHTGVPFPDPDFSKLQDHLDAFKLSVELYYRYYQFYANMFVAIALAAGSRFASGALPSVKATLLASTLEIVLLFASRDSLSRYYTRIAQTLGTRTPRA